MKKVTAKIISSIFHPVLFSILVPFLITFHVTKNFWYAIAWMGFSTLFLLFALGIFFLIRPKQFFSDFDVSKREQRPIFYGVSILFTVLYFFVALGLKGIGFPLTVISLGIIIGLVFLNFANKYLKVSVHTAVVSAYTLTILFVYGFVPFLFVVWIPFAVAWSRVYLKQHTLKEILVGGALGCFVTLLTIGIARFLL